MITTKIARSERDLSIWEDRTFFCVAGGGCKTTKLISVLPKNLGKLAHLIGGVHQSYLDIIWFILIGTDWII